MSHEFIIGRRRTLLKRIQHRVIGLIVWAIPCLLGLRAIAGNSYNHWWTAGVVIFFLLVGYRILLFTLMEPDSVLINEKGLFTTVRGRASSSFPFADITKLVLSGSAISLHSDNEPTLILADRDFRREDWIFLKTLLQDALPPSCLHINKTEMTYRQSG